MAVLVLKVDIDTFRGMKEGVPRIIRVLEKRSVPASFFVSFGPDRSGLAVLQFLRPKFLLKMLRTNAPSMYGLKTALYGTILPAPMIGTVFPDMIRSLNGLGHEVACHAWDHRVWQDWLFLMGQKSVHSWFEKMIEAYKSITDKSPAGFGAPGWRMDSRALRTAGEYGFAYLSCTRAHEPFIFKENDIVEIPSNLPCIEEAGVDGVVRALENRAQSLVPQVLPVHAEVEGGIYCEDFEKILDTAQSAGYTVKRLVDVAFSIDRSKLIKRSLKQGLIPGRAFKCAI
jgi:undecaprenyl phosphate-alpha-L-ara4FN deformylase